MSLSQQVEVVCAHVFQGVTAVFLFMDAAAGRFSDVVVSTAARVVRLRYVCSLRWHVSALFLPLLRVLVPTWYTGSFVHTIVGRRPFFVALCFAIPEGFLSVRQPDGSLLSSC